MRNIIVMTAIAAATLSAYRPASADEANKLTYFTFSKPVQLPGVTLEPGKYRFELADPQESRRVIKVSNEDGTKQLGMLLSIPNQLRDPAKDAIVLFGEVPASEPDAVKAWVYPGERIGYEFIYPHDQAVTLAKKYHTSVLSNSGDKVERVDESGVSSPSDAR
ncbi:MAG: hypothetical protein ACJ770_13185 [Gemmatimonadaceae bacterium]